MPPSCRDIIDTSDARSGPQTPNEHQTPAKPQKIMHEEEIKQQHIILFDGVCNLCNDSVIFILKHEKSPIFRFASIQSETGKKLLAWCGLQDDFSDAVIYIENGEFHLGSTAALKIGRRLKFPWSTISSAGLLVPKFIRDWLYRQIGIHRYQWFGKRDVCMVPTKQLRARFYD
jgi:predicted DCC family thiol-disulfide oxidoreductase YuxK